jgi:hypothetical protein
MKRFCYSALILVVMTVSLSGCQVGPVDEKVAVPTATIEASLRKTLESFEKTGQTGSALTALESDINGIKTTDAAKGAALHKGFLEMQQANTPEKVKAVAKDMLSKL